MSLLSFRDVSLQLSQHLLLDHANMTLHPKDKVALIGRNGAGKSSVIQLMAGILQPDHGTIQRRNPISIATLSQNIPQTSQHTVYHTLVQGLGSLGVCLNQYFDAKRQHDTAQISDLEQRIDEASAWHYLPQVLSMAEHLGLTLDHPMHTLSGGLKRRALLGAALIQSPDLLLLDEPTNHLDLESIEWLEQFLMDYRGSFVLVTHDRTFLNQVTQRIIELDRGHLYPYEGGYETYLVRRELRREEEHKHHEHFKQTLQAEERWIRQGIEARRTRNEGRVKRLKVMREAYRNRREAIQNVKTTEVNTAYSGKIVLEAHDLSYHINNRPIIQHAHLQLMRGDKLGIVGPNGCGKTTLIKLLLKEITPDTGTIRHGTHLNIGYFDQLRQDLDERDTIFNNVADGSDYVTFNGKQRHIASYLQDFLFTPQQLHQPVFSLSGGERHRLLLAKLLAKPLNLLIMDEPTNDLDIETLDILENILELFTGTLILISHDRTFMNHIITSLLVYEQGQFREYVGDYDDYQRVKKASHAPTATRQVKKNTNTTTLDKSEQRLLKTLPQKIERIESEITLVEHEMAKMIKDGRPSEAFYVCQQQLKQLEEHRDQYYAQWEALEKKHLHT